MCRSICLSFETALMSHLYRLGAYAAMQPARNETKLLTMSAVLTTAVLAKNPVG